MHPSQSISSTSANFVNTCQITTSVDTFFPQVVQIANAEERPSTSQSIDPLADSEKCLKEFQFNVEREAVDDKFWNKFKEKLERKSFNELFSNFLLTNWMPKEKYECNLNRIRAIVTKREEGEEECKEQDIILHYDALAEILLYTNLKLRAMSTIYDIIELSDLNSKLNDALLSEKIEIIRKRERKINFINKQYNLIFTKVYLSHQAYLEKTDHEKTAVDIITFRKLLHSQRGGIVKYQKKAQDARLIEKHLPFINECLHNLRVHQRIPTYVGKNLPTEPILSAVSTAPCQEQEMVPAKRRKCVQPISASLSSTQQSSQATEYGYDVSSDTSLHSTEEIKLISLLNKIIGKDTYTYCEINIDDKKNEDNFDLEEYYQSSVMLSALNTKALLLKIKILTAELIQIEKKNCKNTIRRKLGEKFSEFMESHFIYEKNMEMLLSKKVNKQFIDMPADDDIKKDCFSNYENIKIASALFENVQQEYNNVIENCDENILLKRYFEFINSSIVMRRIMDGYSLSHEKINQIAHSILHFSLPISLTKEQLLTLKFQLNRPFVENSFWQVLKNENLSKSEFRRYYSNFILTNWKSSPEEMGELEKNLREAISNHLDSQLRVNLVEKHFREKLGNQAFLLIHHILQLIKKYQKVTSLSLKNTSKKKRIEAVMEANIAKINENYQKASIIHSDYLMIRKSLDSVDIKKLYYEIKACKYYVYANKKFDTEDTEVYILLINKILNKMEKGAQFSRTEILKLIGDYMDDGIFATSTLTATHTTKQLQFVSASDVEEPSVSFQSEASAQPSTSYLQPEDVGLSLLQQSQLPENESASTSTKSITYLAEEKKVTCLLNKLTEKDNYVHYDLNIDDDIKNKHLIVTPEKHYHSSIMFFALNAKTLLLRMKILTAKLIQVENENRNSKDRIVKKLVKELSAFISNHISYENNIAASLDERINQPPVGMSYESMRNKYFDNYRNIKIANSLFTDTQQEYSEVILNCDENMLLGRYVKFISSSLAIKKIKDSYSLSYRKANQIVQSFFNILSVSDLTEEQLAVLKFQIERIPVDDSFWQALKNENLTEFEFRRYYFNFIFTSWKSSPNEIRELEKKIKIATKNHLDLQLRVNLVEKHFQEKMKHQSFQLIHHILQVIKKYHRLKTLPTDCEMGKRKLEREIDENLSKIKENDQKAYKIHSDYLAARASFESVDIIKLEREIKTCRNYICSNSKADKQDTEQYILLINKIIDNVKKNELFTHAMVLEPIRDYMINDKTFLESEIATTPKSHVAKQLQFVPVLSEELNVQTSTFVGTPRLAPASTQLVNAQLSSLALESADGQPLPSFDTINLSLLDIEMQEPQSLRMSSSCKLDEPFLNFAAINTQSSSTSEILQNSISFPLPLIASQQMTNIAKINAQGYGQALKPSIELEQEQFEDQQTSYMEEINTIDFFNR